MLSNHHVVAGADKVIVTMADRKEFLLILLGLIKEQMLLYLKLKEKAAFFETGESWNLEVGEWVLAIGSPFGLQILLQQG